MSTKEYSIKVKCSSCGGTGLMPVPPSGTVPCQMCEGTGLYQTGRLLLDPNIDDIVAKLDSIIAEQASQREDLTAALAQIWNKVKTL